MVRRYDEEVSMHYYPTEGWLDAYGVVLDESDALDDLAVGWGRGFDGDVLFVIEDLPLSATQVGDLPDALLGELPGAVRESVEEVPLADAPELFGPSLRPTLPERARGLLTQIEENVVDGDIYARIGLREGDCTGVEVLGADDDREAGFVVRGDYDVWRQVVDGRPPAGALLSGALVLEGPALYQLRYSAMFQLLGELAADVETTHLFEGGRGSPAEWVLDQAVRQPAFLQRTAERSLSQTLGLF